MKPFFLIIACMFLIFSCAENQDQAGGWIETSNKTSTISVIDSNGMPVQAMLLRTTSQEWLKNAGLDSSLGSQFQISSPESVRVVAWAKQGSNVGINTWIPIKDSAPKITISAPISIQGLINPLFDSVQILGYPLKASVDKNLGRFIFDKAPNGQAYLLAYQGGQWKPAGLVSIKNSGVDSNRYNLYTCADAPYYNGVEKEFISIQNSMPFRMPSADTVKYEIYSLGADSVEVWLDSTLNQKVGSGAQTVIVTLPNTNQHQIRLKQKQSFDACVLLYNKI